MRRNYARFLLLQKTLPAALRERVAQAYLQLGDSYRIEAEQGELKAQTDAQARQRKLKDGQKGSEKPPGESGTPGKQAPQEHR